MTVPVYVGPKTALSAAGPNTAAQLLGRHVESHELQLATGNRNAHWRTC